jgi:parvulin-like peptidyl-prolyl isomerase
MKTKLLIAAAITVFTIPAFAQTNTPGIDQRQMNQEQRIDQGIASGQLNQREANRLERGQDRIDNMENRAKSDGIVTARERARLQHAQNVESQRIYRQKHDRQVRR